MPAFAWTAWLRTVPLGCGGGLIAVTSRLSVAAGCFRRHSPAPWIMRVTEAQAIAIDNATLVRRQHLQGIGLIIAAVTLFCFLDTLAKLSGQHVPTVEVVWFRYSIHFVLAMVFLNPWQSRSAWRTSRLSAQLGRAGLLTLCTGLNFLALRYL